MASVTENADEPAFGPRKPWRPTRFLPSGAPAPSSPPPRFAPQPPRFGRSPYPLTLDAFLARAQRLGSAEPLDVCSYCLERPGDTADHVIPRSEARGIENNLVPACRECNQWKGSRKMWEIVGCL